MNAQAALAGHGRFAARCPKIARAGIERVVASFHKAVRRHPGLGSVFAAHVNDLPARETRDRPPAEANPISLTAPNIRGVIWSEAIRDLASSLRQDEGKIMTHAHETHGRERSTASASASPCGMDPMMAARQRYVASTLVGRRFHDLWMKGDHLDREIPPMTPIKIVSLAYIAHGMYMAFHDGKPLVSEWVRAWTYGPIFPELFNAIKIYGDDAVLEVPLCQREQISYDVRLSPAETGVIDAVYKSYKHGSDTQLIALNHAVGTPWHDTWDGSEYHDIDNGLIFRHFRSILEWSLVRRRGHEQFRQLPLDIF